MLALEPVEPLGCEQGVERLYGADFARLERIEYRTAGRRDDLDIGLPVGVPAEPARQEREQPRGNHELRRAHCIEQRVDCGPLSRAWHGMRGHCLTGCSVGQVEAA